MSMKSYCPKCKQPFEEGVKICLHCGFEPKSKVIAGILQIFLPFGTGRFYLGDIKMGVLQLLATFLCGVGTIWCIIDGIMILTGHAKTTTGGANALDTISRVVNDKGVQEGVKEIGRSAKKVIKSFDID